jgi:hypothetical protein
VTQPLDEAETFGDDGGGVAEIDAQDADAPVLLGATTQPTRSLPASRCSPNEPSKIPLHRRDGAAPVDLRVRQLRFGFWAGSRIPTSTEPLGRMRSRAKPSNWDAGAGVGETA